MMLRIGGNVEQVALFEEEPALRHSTGGSRRGLQRAEHSRRANRRDGLR
jgi:hypothetical protein